MGKLKQKKMALFNPSLEQEDGLEMCIAAIASIIENELCFSIFSACGSKEIERGFSYNEVAFSLEKKCWVLNSVFVRISRWKWMPDICQLKKIRHISQLLP